MELVGPRVRVLKGRRLDGLLTIKDRKAPKRPAAEAINLPSEEGDPAAQRQSSSNPAPGPVSAIVRSALNVLSNCTWLVNARRIRFKRIARYGVGPRAGTAADFPEFTLSAFPL